MKHCLNCDEVIAIDGTRRAGRKSKFCSSTCRVAYHRKEKRYTDTLAMCNEIPRLDGVLVLELFPGAGLFGKAFEALGATVVRGPDILWGGDIRCFRGMAGRFDGVIGGPPCQFASVAAIRGTNALNLIPEFVRVVEECKPSWAVMENVREAKPHAPSWEYVFLRDFDCGGLTHRRRGFWFAGLPAPPAPPSRPGQAEYSVLASAWNKRGKSSYLIRAHDGLNYNEAARLQGYPDLGQAIYEHQPGWEKENGWAGVSKYGRNALAVHMLGNGVPAAMGRYIAEYIATMMKRNRRIQSSAIAP